MAEFPACIKRADIAYIAYYTYMRCVNANMSEFTADPARLAMWLLGLEKPWDMEWNLEMARLAASTRPRLLSERA